MKKKILSLALAFTMITGCGEKSKEKEHFFSQTTSYKGVYENGMLYPSGLEPNKVQNFLDFTSLKKSVFCAVPNCTHSPSSGECLSRLVGEHPVLIGDSVYYFTVNGAHGIGEVVNTPDGPEFVMESKLMRASLDASVTETVCEFTDALIRTWGDYVVLDNMLYFLAYDPDPQFNGMGGASWGSGGGYDFLCSVNLDTGEYKNYGSICYVEDEYPSADNSSGANLAGWYDGKLWLTYSFMKEEPIIDVENPENSYHPPFTTYTFEFDPETEQYTKRDDMPEPLTIEDGYMIYRETDDGLFKAMKDGKVYETYTNNYESVVNGKCCSSALEGPAQWVTLGEDTIHTIGGEYEGYYIVAYHDGKYVLFNDKEAVKLTEEELIALDAE